MAILQLTDVQIFNQALNRLGVTTGLVTAVDGTDTSKYGKLAYPLYQLTRDEELRQNDWSSVRKRVQLVEAQVTDTTASWTGDVVTVADSSKIKVGWFVGKTLIRGVPPVTPPTGIPSGTTVLSITDATHIQMSVAATAAGSGTIVFQVDNETGFLFAYEIPADSLRLSDIYAIYPALQYLSTFENRSVASAPYRFESGYVFTDIAPLNGSPVAEYIYEPTAGTPPFASDFAESLILRIAEKLCMSVNREIALKNNINAEYMRVFNRAFGNANMEEENDAVGEPWWRP